MTQNMKMVMNIIKTAIDTEYSGKKLPTEDQIQLEAEKLRLTLSGVYPLTDLEFDSIKERLPQEILHSIGYADTLRSRDSEHQHWYSTQENDNYFWNRYKELLQRKWSRDVVDRLNITVNDIMDDLGNPFSEEPFQRRGLLLGDVQSGKTATYTAICNKAADAGYRVIIVLAGMMENLRIQTQERLDAEFVGLDSKYTFDKKADSSMKNIRVGVGKIDPFRKGKNITRFTTVMTDFKADILKSNGLNLVSLDGTALFVVKKNKSVLNNLQKWLTKDEDVLNLPMLLIDDEADNASVNTNSEEKDPTAINAAINKILRSFKQATYLGITATPFANIFIDPDISEDGAAKDLFPKDFLTLLPVPDNYIGADKIFGRGDEENWQERSNTQYASSLIPIMNEEQSNFFVFKHKKELANELFYLPTSMCEAIIYFILATAVSDLRFDNKEHRTMMINVSRFTDVQIRTAELVESYINQLKSDIENYSSIDYRKALKIKNISEIQKVWEKYNFSAISGKEFSDVLVNSLNNATRRILVTAVNQKTGATSLDYYNYKDIGMRVIAIGGNSLSRGITLEGLIVSYFYRNTMMYDTLLQMGRWFGYRNNYDDLFKIWMGEDAIDWYGYITDAFNELKDELRQMSLQNQTPEDFGLKVKQDPGALIVTARNKMRSGTKISVPVTLSGRMIETPRLWNNQQIIQENNQLCLDIINKVDSLKNVCREDDKSVKAIIWRNVPKKIISELVREYKCHPWNLNFQPIGISEFIDKEQDPDQLWDMAIPYTNNDDEYIIELGDKKLVIKGEQRKITKEDSITSMLRVSERHVRVGAGGCAKIGLDKSKIEQLRKAYNGKATDKTYLIADRKPIALLHLIYNANSQLKDIPKNIFAIGLGFPGGKDERKANYIVNTTELKNYVDINDMEDEDDVI